MYEQVSEPKSLSFFSQIYVNIFPGFLNCILFYPFISRSGIGSDSGTQKMVLVRHHLYARHTSAGCALFSSGILGLFFYQQYVDLDRLFNIEGNIPIYWKIDLRVSYPISFVTTVYVELSRKGPCRGTIDY